MAIPVENIYYLLCYAWDRLEAREMVDAGGVAGNRTENLLGKVLHEGMSHLFRRGLDRGYVALEEDGRRLRGKLMLSETISRCLLPAGRAVCRADELTYDVPHNRVIKAAMRALLGIRNLDKGLRIGLRDHCRRMSTVADVDLSPAAFRRVQLHRNVAHYAFLMNIARLIAQSVFPDERTGRQRFYPFTAKQQAMGGLFEAFVRNFLRREQQAFRVAAPKIAWDLEHSQSSDPRWLPEMKTDITLKNDTTRAVIDTKYYATPVQAHHGTAKLISRNLYQILTYVSQLGATAGPEPIGVLLYARASKDRNLRYRIGGHTILIRTLDLNQPWPAIHDDLLSLAADLGR